MMVPENLGVITSSSVDVESYTKEGEKDYDVLDLNLEKTDSVRPKKRGRPRLNPYCYEGFSYQTNDFGTCKTDTYKDNSNLKANCEILKDIYSDIDFNGDMVFDYDKDVDNLRDKNETDTRLTSSTDVLSNFNYDTIDNYEVSDSCQTIKNYTTDDYLYSLNDNSEFSQKTNESSFTLNDTNVKDNEDFSFKDHLENDQRIKRATKVDLLVAKDQFSDKDKLYTSQEVVDEKEQLSIKGHLAEKDKRSLELENIYVISEELRQSYIRKSKLLPKIRGVWFNSTVRRMGWVGQAYKKCKRIEKIFSINKHGFEGARNLAIAFRNSQKPTNKSDSTNHPDVSLKDVIKPISQLRINLQQSNTSKEPKDKSNDELSNSTKDKEDHVSGKYKEDKSEPKATKINLKDVEMNKIETDDYSYPIDYTEVINEYKSELKRDDKQVRDNTCKDALLFMLYELEALVELDVPIPPISKAECKRGINFHINFLENSKKSVDILPYINSLAHYICKGITPTDMGHFELYSLMHRLSHCTPLKLETTN